MKLPEEPPNAVDAETIHAALLDVAYEVVEVAKRTGTPVIVWKNGAIRELDPWTTVLPERLHK